MAALPQVIPYRADHVEAWDGLTDRAHGGTVLHSRRFLEHHGTRFRDLSLVAMDPGDGTLSMALPLAAWPYEADGVVSHPGSGLGGLVALSRGPVQTRAFLTAAARHLLDQGFRRLLVHLLRRADDSLLPRLIRLGRVTQLDLWSVLAPGGDLRQRACWKTEMRKAQRKTMRADPARRPEDWAALHDVV